jgi:hypothetical protein
MRQAYALLRMCDKYGDGPVTAACQSALAFDVVDVTRLARMLKATAKPAVAAPGKPQGKLVQLTLPRFARPEQHFETRSNSQQKEEGLAELTSLRFLEADRHVVVLGPVGVGKTFVAQALGQARAVTATTCASSALIRCSTRCDRVASPTRAMAK